jgi:predicted ArsR family transcriptional regulator
VNFDEPTRGGEHASQVVDAGTRQRVLAAVTEHGPVTASEVAARLGLTAKGVRRHLDALAEQGAIGPHDPTVGPARGRGRPARSWVVADAGHEVLASDYDHLAAQALRYLAATAGSGAVDDFARRRAASLEGRYAGSLTAVGTGPAARVHALVGALTSDGYAASARPVGSGALAGIQVCQGHCPVKHVAEEFPQLCQAETDAFSRLLGVHVQRLSTLASGQHVCTTFVPVPTPKERSSR